MKTLDRKLGRDLWRIKGQVAAIALVLASGIALLVMAQGMVASLNQTMRAYYDRYGFADAFVSVTRAPRGMLATLGAIEGVRRVEGRINGAGLVDIPNVDAPISARIVSLPSTEGRINRVHLQSGRLPEPGRNDQILLLDAFAKAHGLRPGDRLTATVYGIRTSYLITGLALSPEFTMVLPPGEFVTDDARYAVLWASEEALEGAFDLDGAFNEAVFLLAPDASTDAVLDAVDRVLGDFGSTGAYARANQISHRFLSEELKQLSTMTWIMSPIFLSVTVFLLNVVISRLVQTEREEIGLMKAFGYPGSAISAHYLKFALVIAALGAVIGWGGGLYLGQIITGIYQSYYKFPFLLFRPDLTTVGEAALISLLAAGLGAAGAARTASRLLPAEAMRPPAPEHFVKRGALGQRLIGLLDQPSRMVLRNLSHKPGRALLLVTGIGAGMSLSIMMQFNVQATDKMLDLSLNITDRSDAFVQFIEPLGERTAIELSQVDGVSRVEPFRGVPVTFRHGTKVHLGSVTGLEPGAVLNRPIDDSLRVVPLPRRGILLSRQLADILGVRTGEAVDLEIREGRRATVTVDVVGVFDAVLGTPAYMDRRALSELLEEAPRISGAYLAVEDEKAVAVQAALKKVPKIAAVSIHDQVFANLSRMLDEGPGTFRRIMSFFSAVIAAGVVYNGARIVYGERQYDLASLRVLGFTPAETGYVVLGEMAVLTLIALPVGAAFGVMLWTFVAGALSTELYQIPTVYARATFGAATALILLATSGAALLVARDMGRLDMVAALKARS